MEEVEFEDILLVQNGNHPVFQFVPAPRTDSFLLSEQLLTPGADGFGKLPGLEQPSIEGRQKLLRRADVQRPAHRHDTANTRLQQRRRHRGKRISRSIIGHRRLAGIQHDGGDVMLPQQRAERFSGDGVGLAVGIFENEMPFRS